MTNTFHLTIARIGENVFDGEAISVTLPGEGGMFTVLAHHEAFVTPLKAGKAEIKDAEGNTQELELPGGGIAEVSHNHATVIL